MSKAGKQDLKPCPFCGAHAEQWAPDDIPYDTIICTQCDAEMADCRSWSNAVAQWNRLAETTEAWVRVEDRLPEKGKRVLVYGNGYPIIGTLMDYGVWATDSCEPIRNVKGWMPLPNRPSFLRIVPPQQEGVEG